MKKTIVSLLIILAVIPVLCLGVAAGGASPFDDLPEGKWYTESVIWCYEHGYMAGTSANTFSPDGKMTRAMVVTVLAAVAGVDTRADVYQKSLFTDVPAGKWYTGPVCWAAMNGVASGVAPEAEE